MGFHEVTRVLATSKTTGYERLALVALAQRVKDDRCDGAAWPGIDTFAKDVNCSERFIQKIVKGWREAPQEVYVIDGGGYKKPNRYILLVGCSFNEVVRRLRINLNIQPAEAEQLASQLGYQKGEQVFTPVVENGEHYDSKTVNIGTSNGERYAKTVNNGSPEQELKHQLKPQPVEHQLLSSCATPIEPPASPAVGEKEETENPTRPDVENEPLVEALARTCGISYPATNPKIATQLGEGVAKIQSCQPDVKPAHFSFYPAYYGAINHGAPARLLPTIRYVSDKWGIFVAWLGQHLDQTETRTISGVGIQMTFTRRQWLTLDDLPVGGSVAVTYWQQGAWVEVELEKTPDGTFREVIAFARESA